MGSIPYGYPDPHTRTEFLRPVSLINYYLQASAICVAYEDMERFFPKNKIKLTGNPIRQDLLNSSCTREEAAMFFGLDPAKKTILIIGGSLGARTINQSVTAHLGKLAKSDVQLIWQTGKNYDDKAKDALSKIKAENIKQMPFISRMDMAYKMADLVISRAGASSISELCLLGKPCILVPSPNVAEDHQTKSPGTFFAGCRNPYQG